MLCGEMRGEDQVPRQALGADFGLQGQQPVGEQRHPQQGQRPRATEFVGTARRRQWRKNAGAESENDRQGEGDPVEPGVVDREAQRQEEPDEVDAEAGQQGEDVRGGGRPVHLAQDQPAGAVSRKQEVEDGKDGQRPGGVAGISQSDEGEDGGVPTGAQQQDGAGQCGEEGEIKRQTLEARGRPHGLGKGLESD